MIRLVIFDLDGTLLNTIADLACGTNYALQQLGYPTHPIESYPAMVGNGVRKLFERALPPAARTAEEVERMRRHFLPYYDVHLADHTLPYEGISEVLQTLRERGVMLAIASNKYHDAVLRIAGHYFPDIPFVAVYGQREGIPIKPDTAIIRDILRDVQEHCGESLMPDEVCYVGDSGVDMQTALNAGFVACGVTWGFRPKEELTCYAPQHIIDTPAELLKIVL